MLIRIYTDGACSGNPGPGGWAAMWNTDTSCREFSGHDTSTTNNRMELYAILRMLERIHTKGRKTDKYVIYSDSAYCVNSIANQWLDRWKASGWKTKQKQDIKNRDLWEKVDAYLQRIRASGKSVMFVKVKGHAGNTFNEMVDKLAREESVKAQALLN